MLESPLVYACWNLDDSVLFQSSSGGMFSVIADKILLQNGVVFGVAYSDSMRVCHQYVETRNKLDRLRKSKYVQSDIGDSFRSAKKFLEDGRPVLFTGTPCQIAGLYTFVGKQKYDHLLTCDLICHGVPSPGVFERYITWRSKQFRSTITQCVMRSKKYGWDSFFMQLLFENNTSKAIPAAEDPFFRGFLTNMFLRRSCYQCRYTSPKRLGDFTLADFWGIGKKVPFPHDTKNGVSLLLVNTVTAEELLKEVRPSIFCEERTLEEAMAGNPVMYKSSAPNPKRDAFFSDYQKLPFEELVKKYLTPAKPKLTLRSFVKKFLPQRILNLGKKLLRR